MDPDEPAFSDTQGQSDFILLPSQEESQDHSATEDVMKRVLSKLPELQGKSATSKGKVLLGDMSTDDERKQGVILVPDSEYDGGHTTDKTGASDFVSDSEADEDDVTIIQAEERRSLCPDPQVVEGQSQQGESGSSFDSKNQSGIGSYDTCEAYKTQKGHVKGYRKKVFPASQEDMFQDTDVETEQGGWLRSKGRRGHTLTPAEHLGSLQISQAAILVPETFDDMAPIPPSPEVYGSTPLIVPSSPTSQDTHEDIEDTRDEVQDDCLTNSENKMVGVPEPDCDDPTLEPESLFLHLSVSTMAHSEAFIIKDSDETENDDDMDLPNKGVSASRIAPSQSKGSGEEDVIMINSDTPQSQPDESYHLSLHLTPTQGDATKGHILSPSRHSSQGQPMDNNNDKANDKNINANMESQNSIKSVTEQQGTQPPETIEGQRSRALTSIKKCRSISLDERQEGGGELLPERQVKSQQNSSGGREVTGVKDTLTEVRGRYDSRTRKSISHLNQNPLILWKDESDTEKKQDRGGRSSSDRLSGEFHLSLPKTGSRTSLDTGEDGSRKKAVDEAVGETGPTLQKSGISLIDQEWEQLEQASKEPWAMSGKQASAPGDDCEDRDNGGQVMLTLGMIGQESELSAAPVFRLERPELLSEPAPSQEESPKTYRSPLRVRVPRHLPDDDDSDDEVIVTKRVPSQEKLTVEQGSQEDVESKEEVLIAQKVQLQEEKMETSEMAEPCEDNDQNQMVAMETEGQIFHDPSEAATFSEPAKEASTKSRSASITRHDSNVSETSTQIKVIEELAGVDVCVVQKVAEYLVSGYSPRSQASSTCTDISDQHGDFLEKGESGAGYHTPQRTMSVDARKSTKTPRSRRPSALSKDNKSPQEIKDILQCYTSILNKKHKHRHKSGGEQTSPLPSSQVPNPAGLKECERNPLIIPRRLSTQSLPVEGMKSPSASGTDGWMSARRLTAPTTPTVSNVADNTENVLKSVDTVKDSKSVENIAASDNFSSNLGIEKQSETLISSVTAQTYRGDKSLQESSVIKAKESSAHHSIKLNLDVRPVSDREENDVFATNGKGLKSQQDNTKKISLKESRTVIIRDENMQQPIMKSSHTIEKSLHAVEKPSHTNIPVHSIEQTSVILAKSPTPHHHHHTPSRSSTSQQRRKLRHSKNKVKRLLRPSERNLHRKPHDSPSPPSEKSGSFVVTTQVFQPGGKGQLTGQPAVQSRPDPYTFHGTQSSPEKSPGVKDTRPGLTPKPLMTGPAIREFSRGGKIKQHAADTLVTPSKCSLPITNVISPPLDQVLSQVSDATLTTIGSLQSIPSTISQSSGARVILSPSSSSSSGRQTATQEITRRLSGKRMSLDQALPDTIPLHHIEEDNYQKVTIVTKTVEKLYREITTTRKVINFQGETIECSEDVKKLEPEVIEESTHKVVQYVYIPSPSRSILSMTSGDLADISSSMSRSSGTSSLGSKVSSLTSSGLDRTESLGTVPEVPEGPQRSGDTTRDVMGTRAGQSAAQTQPPHSTESKEDDVATATSHPPSISAHQGSKSATPALGGGGGLSDQEASDVQTPLGSTINKTGSFHLHSRTASMESPKTSDSLFTSSEEQRKRRKNGEGVPRTESRPQTVEGSNTRNIVEADSSSGSGYVSGLLLRPCYVRLYDVKDAHRDHQAQSPPVRVNLGLVPSSGDIGCRVMARWKDGFYYPGCLKSSEDRFFKCRVQFDDGDTMNVKIGDILLVDKLPVGQSVMVMSTDGDFEAGIIIEQQEDMYMVDTDQGNTSLFPLSQVILTSDQAQCIVADHGKGVIKQLPGQQSHMPANIGDVTLDNLIDAPRRSAKKVPVATTTVAEEEPGSSRGRKRKLESLKPQATSTPTPNRGREGKRRKVEGLFSTTPAESDLGSPSSPRKSSRKAKVELFNQQHQLGPLPTQKLFQGMTFLLTNVVKSLEQQKEEHNLLKDSATETSTDESLPEDDVLVTFDKYHLQSQIEAGGGQVIDYLPLDKPQKGWKCYLLSSSYQRTVKYLQCLARGVPCLSHMWLVDSCTQDKLLDTKAYILPAGISIENKKLVEWKGKTGLFSNLTAIVHSKSEKFVESWSTILRLGECTVLPQLRYADVDVIVTDSSCSGTVERKAASAEVALVSSEWVIQCLVNGRVVSYRGLPKYRHDFLK